MAVAAGSRPARAASTRVVSAPASASTKIPSLSQYKLDMSTNNLPGLIELSPAEYTALGREPEFAGEKVFHAPPADFLGFEWDIRLGVIGRNVYKIVALLECNDLSGEDKAFSVAYDYYVHQLGEPSERREPLITWDAVDGNAILQRQAAAGAYYVLLFLTSKSVLHASIASSKTPSPRISEVPAPTKENLEVSIKVQEQRLEKHPDDFETLGSLGGLYGMLGRYDKALYYFRRAVTVNPSSSSAYLGMAAAYGHLNRGPEKIEACKQAIKLDPSNFEAYLNLGSAYVRSGQHEQAAQALQEAVKLKPDNAEAHFSLGLAYVGLCRKDLALRESEILSKLEPRLEGQLRHFLNGLCRDVVPP